MTQLSDANVKGMRPKVELGNLFLDTDKVPWTPWFIDGIHYKILNIEGEKSTMLVKTDKGAKLAMHRHVFPVELFLLEGSFGYKNNDTGEEMWIGPMGYLYEPPGTVHQPLCPDGSLGIAIFHGPITGCDANGKEIILKTKDYYDRARANNAVGHLRLEGVK